MTLLSSLEVVVSNLCPHPAELKSWSCSLALSIPGCLRCLDRSPCLQSASQQELCPNSSWNYCLVSEPTRTQAQEYSQYSGALCWSWMPWNFGTEFCWIVCLQEALGMLLPLGVNAPKLVKAVPDPLTVFPSPACLPVMAPHRWRPSEILHRILTFLQNT